MQTLRHRAVRRDVTAYFDGELDADRTAAVLRHVRGCWGCSGDLETLRMLRAALRRRAAVPRLDAARLRRFAEGVGRL
jgi:anti-sigma factor RsiW